MRLLRPRCRLLEPPGFGKGVGQCFNFDSIVGLRQFASPHRQTDRFPPIAQPRLRTRGKKPRQIVQSVGEIRHQTHHHPVTLNGIGVFMFGGQRQRPLVIDCGIGRA